jgi:hypothetical protein
MRTMLISGAALAGLMIGVAPQMAQADTYTEVGFSGAINGGSANVKAPFSGNGFTQGDPFSGSFVFDNQLVPAAGSGFTNVFFSNFPDAANIPAASSFNIAFDSLHFTAANNDSSQLFSAGIQYNNGHFNGLEFVTEFSFLANEYQFRIDGPTITVLPVDSFGNPTSFSSLINAHISTGDANLLNPTPFTPTAVPIPPSLGMFCAALAGLGLMLFRSRRRSNELATTTVS